MSDYLTITFAREFLKIPTSSIVYIEADGNYSYIKTADGSKYTVTIQLGQMAERISNLGGAANGDFVRIGRRIIVNVNYIVFISPQNQKLVLSDCRTFRYEANASREALRDLKESIENRIENEDRRLR